MAWYLNPALTRFRDAVNDAYPGRDRESDGTIGDEAHQSGSSDHNPDGDGSVDAWDMDVEVNGRGKPYAEDVESLKRVFEAHPSSKYWIHDDRISFRSEGWKPRSYSYAGPNRNRHEKHVHYNTREEFENSTAPWELEGDDMAIGDDIYRLIHDGLRPEGKAQTANGGVPIAWIVRVVSELKAGQAAARLRDEALLAAVLDDADRDAILARIDARAVDLAQVEAAAREGAISSVDEIVAAIPDELAREVLDGLAARLAA